MLLHRDVNGIICFFFFFNSESVADNFLNQKHPNKKFTCKKPITKFRVWNYLFLTYLNICVWTYLLWTYLLDLLNNRTIL